MPQNTLARFYVAYRRLVEYWQSVLGERLVIVDYEALAARPAEEIRQLLGAVGLPFEAACLEFANNRSATATASAVQVREGIHARSVGRWKRYERQLQPLRQHLENAGVVIA